MAVFDQNKADLLSDFEQSLKELTFPALPVIENLTEIARENTDVAEKILQLIKTRIAKSIPDHKLALLYLFDSIVKKIGPPYNILVGDEIFEIYSNSYLLVNDKTRQRLLNLFETWKNTKLKGSNSPLFPRNQMDKIERFLQQANKSKSGNEGDVYGSGSGSGFGSGFNTASSTAPSSTHTTPGSTPSLPNKPMLMDHSKSTLTNASLIKDIDTLIPFSQNKLLNNPSDSKLQERINALSKLRTLLSSQTMTVKELQTIQDRLRNIMQQEFGSSGNSTPTGMNAVPVQAPVPTVATAIHSSLSSSNSPSQSNIANDFFNMLIASGLVKVDQSLIPGSPPKYELKFPRIIKTGSLGNSISSASNSALERLLYGAKNGLTGDIASSHTNNINNNTNTNTNGGVIGFETLKNIELNKLNVDPKNLQKFINSNKPSSVSISLLYDSKPSKCGTCGKRFSDDENGIQRRRLHLDWHFRVNKRLSSNTSTTGGKGGIIQSRNWYLDGYDWVKFKDENLLEYSTNGADSANAMNSLSLSSSSKASTPTPGSNSNNPTSIDGLLLNDGKVPFVVIPTNETNMINKCQICQDQINATYDDDSGEWRWVNCIKAPGEGKNSRKIFHATCFLEANKKRGADGDLNVKVKREKI